MAPFQHNLQWVHINVTAGFRACTKLTGIIASVKAWYSFLLRLSITKEFKSIQILKNKNNFYLSKCVSQWKIKMWTKET